VAAIKAENLSSTNLIIIMLLITLLAIGAAGIIGKALVGSIVRDTKVVSAKKTAENNLKHDLAQAPSLVSAYSGLNDKARTIADALPTTPDFPGLLVTLENMTAGAGLELRTVTPSADLGTASGVTAPSGDASMPPTPQPYKFGLNFTGSYISLYKFLGEVENSARPMRVVDIQMAGGGNTLTGQIDIQTYYQDKAQLPFSEVTIK
jgi:hypothetical protein